MDKLTDFGHTFQIKSISALMKNQTFLEQIHDILDEKTKGAVKVLIEKLAVKMNDK